MLDSVVFGLVPLPTTGSRGLRCSNKFERNAQTLRARGSTEYNTEQLIESRDAPLGDRVGVHHPHTRLFAITRLRSGE